MQQRDNLTHLILVLVLTPLMIAVAAQAQITFVSNRDGHVHPRLGWPTYDIYVMDADGGNQQNLTNDPNFDSSPSWSPDGKRIVFTSDRDGHFDMPGGLPNDEIYVMDADGGNLQNLTNDPNNDWDPSWSPDGKRIVFMSRRDGHFIGDFGLSSEIYVMDADGKNTRRLTNNRKTDWAPSWSPDGKWIAFASDRKGDDVNFEIYVMDADGGNQQKLTNNPHSDSGPAWFGPAFAVSPAGKKFMIWGWLKRVDR